MMFNCSNDCSGNPFPIFLSEKIEAKSVSAAQIFYKNKIENSIFKTSMQLLQFIFSRKLNRILFIVFPFP
jgi:hypothetical protein